MCRDLLHHHWLLQSRLGRKRCTATASCALCAVTVYVLLCLVRVPNTMSDTTQPLKCAHHHHHCASARLTANFVPKTMQFNVDGEKAGETESEREERKARRHSLIEGTFMKGTAVPCSPPCPKHQWQWRSESLLTSVNIFFFPLRFTSTLWTRSSELSSQNQLGRHRATCASAADGCIAK